MLPPCLFYRLDHSSGFILQLSWALAWSGLPSSRRITCEKVAFHGFRRFRIPKAHKWTTEIRKNDAWGRPSNLLGDRSFAWQRNTSLIPMTLQHIATRLSLRQTNLNFIGRLGPHALLSPSLFYIVFLHWNIQVGSSHNSVGHWPEGASAVSAVASCAGAFSPGKGLLGPLPSWKGMGHLKICFTASSWN